MPGNALQRYTPQLVGAAALLGFVGFWEAAAAYKLADPMFISSPSRIATVAAEMWEDPDFWRDVKVSSTEFIWGYLAAIAVGIPLGLVIGCYKRAQYALGPFIDVLNAVPRVTFMPIMVLWFGIGICVALSRVMVRLHHLSDIIGGAFVGTALGIFAVAVVV